MENYLNLRKRQEGFNGSSRTVIGADFNLPDRLGNGVFGYSISEACDSFLGMLDHQAPRVRIKSEPDVFERAWMGYAAFTSKELGEIRTYLRGKRPDVQFV